MMAQQAAVVSKADHAMPEKEGILLVVVMVVVVVVVVVVRVKRSGGAAPPPPLSDVPLPPDYRRGKCLAIQ